MKKSSFTIVAMVIIAVILASGVIFCGCGGSSGGENNNNPIIDDNGSNQNNGNDDNQGGGNTGNNQNNNGNGDTGYIGDSVVSIIEVEDYGLTADFEIMLDFSQFLAGGEMFFKGQDYPDGPWVYYPIDVLENNPIRGQVTIEWPKGQSIEFSYGIRIAGIENWTDPSKSKYLFNGHFMVILGTEEFCENDSINDNLVPDILFLGGNRYQVYLNFQENLPIEDYQKLFVNGQDFPNGPWISYAVTDDYPCYYFEIEWPDGGGPFEFSFGVIKQDGTEQWIDPTGSTFFYDGHLAINLTAYK